MSGGARGRRGFTLVEVLVATAVLAMGLLAALTAFSMASRVAAASYNDTAIVFLAQWKLAEVQVAGSTRLRPGTTTGDFGPGYPGYSWRLTIGARNRDRLVPVRLTVYARESGRQRAVTFSTALL